MLLQIYFLDDFYHMCTTDIVYSTYYQKTCFEDCPSTSINNARQSSNKSRFYSGKALQKTYWNSFKIFEASISNMIALSHCFELSSGQLRPLYLRKKKEKRERQIYLTNIYSLYTKLLLFTHIGTRGLCKFLSLIDNISEYCLITWGLRLVCFLHVSEIRFLYSFLSLIRNTPEHCNIYRSSRLVQF